MTSALPAPVPPKQVIAPTLGEVITSLATGCSYTMANKIGEGEFGVVYACTDSWDNDLAAKVLKPVSTYERVKGAAESEFAKLLQLRNPFITYVYDAFEFRDTFYLITERCGGSLELLFARSVFNGLVFLMPVARCLLQAVDYLHRNGYVHQDIHLGNVYFAFVKDEMTPEDRQALQFKLGDLGVARLLPEVNTANTRAQWMLPPEVLDPQQFGPADAHLDIYHVGLLLLQLAYSRKLTFTRDEILAGAPRHMALQLDGSGGFALEKALRRRVAYRTATAMELWRDLHTPPPTTPSAPPPPTLGAR